MADSATRTVPFEDIEQNWHLATWALSPAVGRRNDSDGYYIRVVNSRPGSPRFGYFEVAADGTVLTAPRGYTKDYKPGRITGLTDAVVEKYQQIHRAQHPRYANPAPAERKPIAPTGKPAAITLPPLDIPCPHCTPEDVQKRMDAEYKAWSDEEFAAYEKFAAAYEPSWEAHDAWKRSDTYRALTDREPTPAGAGCVECDWKQRVLTDAGRLVLAFLDFWRDGK